MRVLLLSTYELGAQPLGCARPAAVLGGAGHETLSRDLAVERLDERDLDWAEAVAVSVPMHTALRLAVPLLERLRGRRRPLPVALHGLYAPVGVSAGLLVAGDLAAAGEVGPALVEWLAALGAGRSGGTAATGGPAVRVELGPARPAALLPARDGLPGLDRYARLVGGPAGDGERLVATLEATRGCSHRCRHCPVPVVYDGRTRAVEVGALLADLDVLVALGAGHVHFADPDFFNRPRHALAVVRALHERHRQLSYDATVKVSHVLDHADLWDEMAAAGCCFVVSAVESTSDTVLARLDKGHRAAQASQAVEVLRRAGIEPRPSLLPFTPWTTRDDLVALLDFVAAHDLAWNVDPVQWGIRLLLPPGSLLLDDPDAVLAAAVAAGRGRGDGLAAALGVPWTHADPLLDELQPALAREIDRSAAAGEPAPEAYAAIRELVFAALGRADPGPPPPRSTSPLPGPARPRLTESWFCCAEPSSGQLARAGGGPAGVSVGGCPPEQSRALTLPGARPT